MSGVNKVLIIGRLGQNPELKTLGSGQAVTNFSVATSENWIAKNGEKQERTEWHRIVVWGKQAETCAKHLAKGRQVYVEGRLQTRQWEDSSGQKKYTTEIVATTVQFLGSAAGGENRTTSDFGGGGSEPDFGPEPSFDPGDEIPF